MAKAPAKAGKKKSFKKKEKRVVHNGIVHIQATFNNTIVTIADLEGNTISWSSAGSLGFRGSRKGTPFAAQQAAMTAANKASESGLRTVEVRVSGPGSGRESAVRALQVRVPLVVPRVNGGGIDARLHPRAFRCVWVEFHRAGDSTELAADVGHHQAPDLEPRHGMGRV